MFLLQSIVVRLPACNCLSLKPDCLSNQLDTVFTCRFASEFVPTQQGEGFADIYTAKDVDEIARFVAFIGPAQLMFSSRSASVAPYDSAFAQSPGQHQPQPMGWHARPPIHAIPSYFGCGPQAQPQASPWNGKPAPWASGVVYGQHQSQQKQQWRPPLQQQQQHPAQQRVQRVSPSSEASPHNPQAGTNVCPPQHL